MFLITAHFARIPWGVVASFDFLGRVDKTLSELFTFACSRKSPRGSFFEFAQFLGVESEQFSGILSALVDLAI